MRRAVPKCCLKNRITDVETIIKLIIMSVIVGINAINVINSRVIE